MKATKYATLLTTYKVMKAHNKYWSTVTRAKLIYLLEKYHTTKIGKRALNYHLKDLRDEGLIKTYRNWGRFKDGTIYLKASSHCITVKGYRLLMVMGVREAYKRIKELTKRYLPSLDTQNDRDNHTRTQEIPPRKTGKNPFLDPEFRKRKGFKEITPFAV